MELIGKQIKTPKLLFDLQVFRPAWLESIPSVQSSQGKISSWFQDSLQPLEAVDLRL